ncbi:MFS general substrate transporter [Testicularia cyperi]|uniref:MFS general substrate transporter n=1 Tax=Testicularia cyperi TaxID=1882483 RepID=A0A317XZW2_9BASI|nr:MFS general substrate transporter [Testicularia cyperi]
MTQPRRRVRFSAKRILSTLKEDGEPKEMLLKEVSLYTCFALAGWVDATTGALLPAIRASYDLSFSIVSMLFVGNLCGCIVASFSNSPLVDKIGFGKAISLAAAAGTVLPILFLTLPPYPVLVVGMAVSGFSTSMLDTLVNVWMSQRPRANVRLGVVHFLYGFGALSSPLAAIPFIHEGRKGPAFQHFYFVSLGLAVIVTALVTIAFKLQRDSVAEVLTDESGEAIELQQIQRSSISKDDAEAAPSTDGAATPNSARTAASHTGYISPSQKLVRVLKLKVVYVLSVFTMIYVGTEVTVGGWTSTYLIEVRNEQSNANYLISGFWGGIALGRILLIPVTSMLGDELACFVYLVAAVGLQVLVWLVPNVIANAVALALLGLFLGPIFPIMIRYASRKVRPRAYLTAAISFIATFGAAGMALLPLIVGLASQAASEGIKILAPILVGLLSFQALIWVYANHALFTQMALQRSLLKDADGDDDRVD